jgi:hypothetical protein
MGKKFSGAIIAASAALMASSASAASCNNAAACPAIGLDSGPGIILNVGPGGAVTVTVTGQGPYDGVEDTYIGVNNNTGAPLSSITGIHSTLQAFGFDGDGIGTYAAVGSNTTDTSSGKYGGPNAYFTNISLDLMSGDVNFIKPIGIGGSDIFSLEENIAAAGGGGITVGVPEPSTWAMMLLGFLGLGFLGYRKSKRQNARVAA